jgi:hypothetical protein
MYDMLSMLDKVVAIMPGKKPHRHEFITLGEFVDGNIECLAAVYLGKVTCPWELDVLLIANWNSREKTEHMLDFIGAMCQENAVLPNYEPLGVYSCLQEQLVELRRSSSASRKVDSNGRAIKSFFSALAEQSASPQTETMQRISLAYQAANKARIVCLDTIPQISLGPYWYELSITRPDGEADTPLAGRTGGDAGLNVVVYLRQFTRSSNIEFEVSFVRPTTGTDKGSGTVGGALILPAGRASQVVPSATADYFAAVCAELTRRVIHPDISSIPGIVTLRLPHKQK